MSTGLGGRRRRRAVLGSAAALVAGMAGDVGAAVVLPPDFELRPVVTGLDLPTAFAPLPDGRTVVAEKGGRVKVGMPGSTTARLVLDLRAEVNHATDRGLVGIAANPVPTTAGDHEVFLLFTRESPDASSPDSGTPVSAVLERFLLAPDNTPRAGSRAVVLGRDGMGRPCPNPPVDTADCLTADGPSHTVGTVRLAPDGTLLVGNGDSSDAGVADPDALRTYDERSTAGKILHVDRQGRGLPGHTFCPGVSDLSRTCTKVYAKGLRNPFRFVLRPRGGLLIGDVGWRHFEELDVVTGPGANLGWPCREGPAPTPGYDDFAACNGLTGLQAPSAWTCHDDLVAAGDCPAGLPAGRAIIGGPLYDRSTYPATWAGWTFVGDFNNKWLKAVMPGTGGGRWRDFATGFAAADLQLNAAGNLVFATLGTFAPGAGSIQEIRYVGTANRTPTAVATADRLTGPAPLTVRFSAGGSTDPDGDALTLRWDFGDGATSTSVSPSRTFARGRHLVRLTVRDPAGATDRAELEVVAGLSAPAATITAPADRSTYRGGDTIAVTGTATDPDDGTLPGSSLSWDVLVAHGDHHHVQLQGVTGSRITFPAVTDHSADGHVEVRLVATDSDGIRSPVRSIRLDPQVVGVTLGSSPAGVPLSFGGRTVTDATNDEAIGFRGTLSAPLESIVAGRLLRFTGWSDGGARTRDLTVPAAPLALTARYRVVDRAPIVSLDAGDGLFRDGVRRFLSATASDPDAGDTVTTAWRVTRTDTGGNVVASGTDLRPRFTPNVSAPATARYLVTFTATDAAGVSSSRRVTLAPELTDVRVVASHAGVALRNGGVRKEPIGRLFTVAAPAEATTSTAYVRFVRWSDDGAREHQVSVPEAGLDLTAHFERINRPPTVTFGTDRRYRDGVKETAEVVARDPDGGDVLTGRWQVTRTDTGGNVVREGTGLAPSWYPNATAPATARYVVALTVTDQGGLSATASATFAPETVRVVVRADPSSIAIAYGGGDRLEPIGRRMTVRAYPSSGSYGFASWSDGGAREHEVVVPVAGLHLVARYAATTAAQARLRRQARSA